MAVIHIIIREGGSLVPRCSGSGGVQQLAKEGGASLLGRGRELGGRSERANCHEEL